MKEFERNKNSIRNESYVVFLITRRCTKEKKEGRQRTIARSTFLLAIATRTAIATCDSANLPSYNGRLDLVAAPTSSGGVRTVGASKSLAV